MGKTLFEKPALKLHVLRKILKQLLSAELCAEHCVLAIFVVSEDVHQVPAKDIKGYLQPHKR